MSFPHPLLSALPLFHSQVQNVNTRQNSVTRQQITQNAKPASTSNCSQESVDDRAGTPGCFSLDPPVCSLVLGQPAKPGSLCLVPSVYFTLVPLFSARPGHRTLVPSVCSAWFPQPGSLSVPHSRVPFDLVPFDLLVSHCCWYLIHLTLFSLRTNLLSLWCKRLSIAFLVCFHTTQRGSIFGSVGGSCTLYLLFPRSVISHTRVREPTNCTKRLLLNYRASLLVFPCLMLCIWRTSAISHSAVALGTTQRRHQLKVRLHRNTKTNSSDVLIRNVCRRM